MKLYMLLCVEFKLPIGIHCKKSINNQNSNDIYYIFILLNVILVINTWIGSCLKMVNKSVLYSIPPMKIAHIKNNNKFLNELHILGGV